jgi:hypothetical protein
MHMTTPAAAGVGGNFSFLAAKKERQHDYDAIMKDPIALV